MNNHTLPLSFPLNNKYRIEKVLGQGGFGITYLAEDTVLDVNVCIKELFVTGSSTRGSDMTVLTHNMKDFSFADFKERFIQEAKQLAKFKHPNIVRVQDFFEANNTAYVVMEYIEGQTLKDKVAYGGPLPADASQKIIESILDAVEVVHRAGMLHRDIKPDNLIIGNDGRVVLIDFGSARAFSDEKTIAQTAMVSPGYAPLEQYNPNARKGAFTDIYSIGATFYFMLTGEKPLNVTERYTERLKAPHEINQNVSMQVSSAVMLAMEIKTEDRFQNVADFRVALQQLNSSYSRNEEAGPVSNTAFLKPEIKETPLLSGEMIDSFGMEFILVKAGSFMMGAADKDKEAEKHEKPSHKVVLGNDYYIGKFTVTQDKWERIMGNNPSHFKSSKNLPVESVSWNEVQQFIDKLNKNSNLKYRLPSEAEWEFAAKGGLKTANFIYSGSNNPEDVAWFKANSKEMTQPVGSKKANELGIFDMSGNVWEWCHDFYDMYSNALQNNPRGPQKGINKVLRGGGWVNNPKVLRISDRGNIAPDKKGSIIGFRLLLEI